jgi:hypothetical protein
MLVVHRTGIETVLPQMPAPAVHTVNVLGIKKMGPTNSLSKSHVISGDGDDMNMIGHQAIAQHVQAEPLGLFLEQFEVNRSVIGYKENILLIISTLSDVMRNIFQNYSGYSRHNRKYNIVTKSVN